MGKKKKRSGNIESPKKIIKTVRKTVVNIVSDFLKDHPFSDRGELQDAIAELVGGTVAFVLSQATPKLLYVLPPDALPNFIDECVLELLELTPLHSAEEIAAERAMDETDYSACTPEQMEVIRELQSAVVRIVLDAMAMSDMTVYSVDELEPEVRSSCQLVLMTLVPDTDADVNNALPRSRRNLFLDECAKLCVNIFLGGVK